jgi:hypothetical protein
MVDKDKRSATGTPVAQPADVTAPTAQTTQQTTRKKVALLYDGTYESAFTVARLARDIKKGEHDFSLIVLVPKLAQDDAQTLEKVKEIVEREGGHVEYKTINAEIGETLDKVSAGIKTALDETLKIGANHLKVAWTTDRINSNKDVYQTLVSVKGRQLTDEINDNLPENIAADKANKPRPVNIGIDWVNFGKDNKELDKHRVNLNLHEVFKKQATEGLPTTNEPQPLGS